MAQLPEDCDLKKVCFKNKGTYSFWAQSSAFGAEVAVRIAEWEESQVCSALSGRDVVYYF